MALRYIHVRHGGADAFRLPPRRWPISCSRCFGMQRRRRRGTSGLVLLEYMLTLPLLLVILIGLVDCGQLILMHAQLDHLTREAGNLSSRGITTDDTWATLLLMQSPLDLSANSQLIFTTVAARSDIDTTPWVQSQTTRGTRSFITSRVGAVDAAATIPGIDSLPNGVTMVAVEAAYSFSPIIPPPVFAGLTLPEHVDAIAYF
jgi:Flp pilus assembly protein TadG